MVRGSNIRSISGMEKARWSRGCSIYTSSTTMMEIAFTSRVGFTCNPTNGAAVLLINRFPSRFHQYTPISPSRLAVFNRN